MPRGLVLGTGECWFGRILRGWIADRPVCSQGYGTLLVKRFAGTGVIVLWIVNFR